MFWVLYQTQSLPAEVLTFLWSMGSAADDGAAATSPVGDSPAPTAGSSVASWSAALV